MHKWKFVGSISAWNSVPLPNEYLEILAVVEIPYTGYPLGVFFVLSKNDMTDVTRYFDSGSPNAYARIGAHTDFIALNHAYAYNAEYTNIAILKVYYR